MGLRISEEGRRQGFTPQTLEENFTMSKNKLLIALMAGLLSLGVVACDDGDDDGLNDDTNIDDGSLDDGSIDDGSLDGSGDLDVGDTTE